MVQVKTSPCSSLSFLTNKITEAIPTFRLLLVDKTGDNNLEIKNWIKCYYLLRLALFYSGYFYFYTSAYPIYRDFPTHIHTVPGYVSCLLHSALEISFCISCCNRRSPYVMRKKKRKNKPKQHRKTQPNKKDPNRPLAHCFSCIFLTLILLF